MSVDHVILCGGARLTSRANRWKQAKTHRLKLGKGARDIHLDINAIPEHLAAALPDVAADLVELAAYAYTADGACTRGGEREFEYGTKWRRYFRFEVPVRQPGIWTRDDIKPLLEETLGFLSDDDYEFHFTQLRDPPAMSRYLPFKGDSDSTRDIEEIMLFSGGLDSFAGAAHEVLAGQRRAVLVSHVSTEKIGKPQRELAEGIATLSQPGRPIPWHVQINLNKGKALGRESTQRTRSFVYASLGAVIARMLGRSRLRFYENGVISFNLPTSLQVLGGRASRTTHPRALSGLANLIAALFDTEFCIENPFLWKTKAEILRELKASGHAHLCAKTISCAKTIERTLQHSHCGRCSQCVDRRLVAIAAGFDDTEDPEIMYDAKMDSPRDDVRDRTMIERYFGAALRIRAMADAQAFMREYGEVARVLRHLNTDSETALDKVFELHKRHANQIFDSLVHLIHDNADRLVEGSIPVTSPIGIAAGLSKEFGVEAATPSQLDHHQKAGSEDNGFRIDPGTFTVWNGGKSCTLRNTKEFWTLTRLARSPGVYISHDTLIEDVWEGATRSKGLVHKTISNLRRRLRESGVCGITILAQKDHYALQISENGKH